MKDTIRFFAVAAVCMLLLPAAALAYAPADAAEELADNTETHEDTTFYSVYMTSSDTVEQISVRDYLIGAVAAEMPASYEPEALKAQVIASHTYAERMRQQNAASPDAALCGADFSDDSSVYQAFYTTAQLRLLWGAQFDVYYQKITDAVDAVGDSLLYYEDAPIVAAFHAISSGVTESAEAVWDTDLPYLSSVSSDGDISAPQYETVCEYTPDTVRATLCAICPEIALPEDPSAWISIERTTDAGTVLCAAVGSEILTGQQLREAFALRSACFSVAFTDGVFRFAVKGYGHSVGMSQYGANQMARSGSTYEEILSHYYTGAELRSA